MSAVTIMCDEHLHFRTIHDQCIPWSHILPVLFKVLPTGPLGNRGIQDADQWGLDQLSLTHTMPAGTGSSLCQSGIRSFHTMELVRPIYDGACQANIN